MSLTTQPDEQQQNASGTQAIAALGAGPQQQATPYGAPQQSGAPQPYGAPPQQQGVNGGQGVNGAQAVSALGAGPQASAPPLPAPAGPGGPTQYAQDAFTGNGSTGGAASALQQQMIDAALHGDQGGGKNLFGGTVPVAPQIDPAHFKDPNQQDILGVVHNQIDNRANMAAPTAAQTALGGADQYGGAGVGPVFGAGAAGVAPQMMLSGAQIDQQNDLQYAAAQNAQINNLAGLASGQGPSVAETAAAQQAEHATAQQMAMLGSQRGAGSAALGARQAALAGSQAHQAAAAVGALGRSQEATAAQNTLAQTLQAARGQTQATTQTQAQLNQAAALANQGVASQAGQTNAQLAQAQAIANMGAGNAAALQQAGLSQQAGLANQGANNQFALQQGQMNQATELANQQAQLAQTGMNNQQYNVGEQAYMTQSQQATANQMALEQLRMQQYGIDKGIGIQNAQLGMQGVGAAAAGLGALAMFASDRRLKKNVRPGAIEVRSFLESIRRER